jgi:hypothetical protein
MVLTPGIKRLMMGGWVLAALLIFAYNAQLALTVLETPLPAHSREAKLAMQKARQLERQSAEKKAQEEDKDFSIQKIVATLDRGLTKIKQEVSLLKQPVKIKKLKGDKEVVKTAKKEEPIILPVLTGIVQVFNAEGKGKLLAAMDGQIYRENEFVKAFRIMQITDNGVTLAKGDRTWQIKAPIVNFSISQ